MLSTIDEGAPSAATKWRAISETFAMASRSSSVSERSTGSSAHVARTRSDGDATGTCGYAGAAARAGGADAAGEAELASSAFGVCTRFVFGACAGFAFVASVRFAFAAFARAVFVVGFVACARAIFAFGFVACARAIFAIAFVACARAIFVVGFVAFARAVLVVVVVVACARFGFVACARFGFVACARLVVLALFGAAFFFAVFTLAAAGARLEAAFGAFTFSTTALREARELFFLEAGFLEVARAAMDQT